jgi:hypothetical protein
MRGGQDAAHPRDGQKPVGQRHPVLRGADDGKPRAEGQFSRLDDATGQSIGSMEETRESPQAVREAAPQASQVETSAPHTSQSQPG